jgi:hypothetical protein
MSQHFLLSPAAKTLSTVHADEASHWDRLAALFPIKRINHQDAYQSRAGRRFPIPWDRAP